MVNFTTKHCQALHNSKEFVDHLAKYIAKLAEALTLRSILISQTGVFLVQSGDTFVENNKSHIGRDVKVKVEM